LIIDKSFKCYLEILNGNQERLKKINKILSYYKKYLSREYLFQLKDDFEECELKKLKLFEIVAKIILANEKYDIDKLNTLDQYDIDKINDYLNKKYLKNINKKAIIIFSNLLSNIRNEDIHVWETILNKKINKKKFSNIIINSFKEHYIRFLRTKYNLEMFPRSLIDKHLKNIRIYDENFENENDIHLPGVPTLLDSIFHVHHYLKNAFKDICISKKTKIAGKISKSLQLNYICKRPSSILSECLVTIFDISRYLERTSPNSTEETFSIFTTNDLKKAESLSIIKQLSAHDSINSENQSKNRELLLEAAEKFRKKKIDEKYNDDKALMDEEADNDDDLYHDPSNYLNHKKKIEDLGEAGEFFNSIIINNKKERKRLNKYLKKFFDLEIAVLDLNYFKNFSNLEKIKVKQLLSDVEFSTRKFNDKFVMIKDLKFKKKFSIHGIEIGKGPSNIFPFLLQILNDKPNLIFAIQELENNWHPKNHSKLILLLVEILKLSKNKSYILETHSELFILQIQKLVQKGVLKPDDVSINYISRSKDGYSEIINLPLNSNGGFEKKWPGGFFTERMEILTS